MRKHMVAILVVWVVLSCNKIDSFENNSAKIVIPTPVTERRGFKITEKDALEITLNTPGIFSTATKSENKMILNSLVLCNDIPKKGRSIQVDTLAYVVNFADNGGYVFVSPDERSGEVLAFFESGNFCIQDTIDNPGQKFMVDLILDYQTEQLSLLNQMPNDTQTFAGLPGMPGASGSVRIPATETFDRQEGNTEACARMNAKYPGPAANKYLGVPVKPPIPPQPEFPLGPPGPDNPDQLFDYEQYYRTKGCRYITSYRNEKHNYKAPMLITSWDQYSPLNDYAPKHLGARAPAGCAPIAAAQIMAYHKFPSKIPDKNNLKYRGEDIYMEQLAKCKDNSEINNSSNEVKAGAAKLVRALGDAMNVIYTDAFGTGMPSLALSGGNQVIETFEMFGYSIPNAFLSYSRGNMPALRKSLDENKPVFVYAFRNKTHTKGHVWVIDGYEDDYYRTYNKEYLFDERGFFNGVGRASLAYAKDNEFVHCSMGWGYKIHPNNTADPGNTDCWFNGYVFDCSTGDNNRFYQYNIRFLPGITKP